MPETINEKKDVIIEADNTGGHMPAKSEIIRLTKEILTPALPVDCAKIAILIPHSKTCQSSDLSSDNSLFKIFIWSQLTIRHPDSTKYPAQLWGIDVSCRDAGFPSSGQGIDIIGPDENGNNVTAAELIGNNLFIHHDVCHYGDLSELKLYAKILKEVTGILKNDAPTENQEDQFVKLIGVPPAWHAAIRDVATKTMQPVLTARDITRLHFHWLNKGTVLAPEKWSASDGKTFHVYAPCSTVNTEQINAPLNLLGVNNCQPKMFSHCWADEELFDEHTGAIFGALTGHCLFIPITFHSNGCSDCQALLAKIMEAAARHLSQSTEDKKGAHADQTAKTQRAYVNACGSRRTVIIDSLRQREQENNNALAETRKRLIELIREQEFLNGELAALQNNGALDVKFAAEFEAIRRMKKIDKIHVDLAQQILYVKTKTLYCHSQQFNTWHEIGRFCIAIDMTGQRFDIRWHNLTRRIVGYSGYHMQAPHIWPEGKACLGSVTSAVLEVISKHEYEAAVQIAIIFAESVNEEDAAGKYIKNWPEVKSPEQSGGKENEKI